MDGGDERPNGRTRFRLALFVATALAAGCTTGQANTTPPISPGGGGGGSTSNYVLQLSVGTANFAGAIVGLNVFETFRDANGFTAVPISSAVLKTPASLHGVAGSKDPGAHDTGRFPLGSASNQFVIGGAGQSTVIAGADGFGIGPPSCSCPGVNFYPMQPQFADNPKLSNSFPGGSEPIYGGPPAYPPTVLTASSLSSLVSIPSSSPLGFYLMGFDKVPSGTYTLSASYSQNGGSHTVSASAHLNGRRVLPTLQIPILTAHKDGSVDVALTLPRGVKQAIVFVIDSNVPPVPGATCITGLGFATVLFDKSGTKTISGNLGNYGRGGAQTFCGNDLIVARAFGFDYDDFDLGPPGNVQQRPALPAQADMTISNQSLAGIPK